MSEANFLTKALTDTVLTRRSFLKCGARRWAARPRWRAA